MFPTRIAFAIVSPILPFVLLAGAVSAPAQPPEKNGGLIALEPIRDVRQVLEKQHKEVGELEEVAKRQFDESSKKIIADLEEIERAIAALPKDDAKQKRQLSLQFLDKKEALLRQLATDMDATVAKLAEFTSEIVANRKKANRTNELNADIVRIVEEQKGRKGQIESLQEGLREAVRLYEETADDAEDFDEVYARKEELRKKLADARFEFLTANGELEFSHGAGRQCKTLVSGLRKWLDYTSARLGQFDADRRMLNQELATIPKQRVLIDSALPEELLVWLKNQGNLPPGTLELGEIPQLPHLDGITIPSPPSYGNESIEALLSPVEIFDPNKAPAGESGAATSSLSKKDDNKPSGSTDAGSSGEAGSKQTTDKNARSAGPVSGYSGEDASAKPTSAPAR